MACLVIGLAQTYIVSTAVTGGRLPELDILGGEGLDFAACVDKTGAG
jgi:hypothetical protein